VYVVATVNGIRRKRREDMSRVALRLTAEQNFAKILRASAQDVLNARKPTTVQIRLEPDPMDYRKHIRVFDEDVNDPFATIDVRQPETTSRAKPLPVGPVGKPTSGNQ
jgi:hypothetical protein